MRSDILTPDALRFDATHLWKRFIRDHTPLLRRSRRVPGVAKLRRDAAALLRRPVLKYEDVRGWATELGSISQSFI